MEASYVVLVKKRFCTVLVLIKLKKAIINLIIEGAFNRSYNPGQKSSGQYCNIHIFLSFLGSLFKHCILFEIFWPFSLPPPYTKLKPRKILDIRVQHCLWGRGRSWTCVNWKTPQKRKSVPRLLSLIVDGDYIMGGL